MASACSFNLQGRNTGRISRLRLRLRFQCLPLICRQKCDKLLEYFHDYHRICHTMYMYLCFTHTVGSQKFETRIVFVRMHY